MSPIALEVAEELIAAAIKLWLAHGKDPSKELARIHEDYSKQAQALADGWQ